MLQADATDDIGDWIVAAALAGQSEVDMAKEIQVLALSAYARGQEDGAIWRMIVR